MSGAPRNRRLAVAFAAALLGLALLAGGLWVRDAAQWRLQLLCGLWLCSLLPRAIWGAASPEARSAGRLMLVFCLLLGAVGLTLVREQLTLAAVTRERVAALARPAGASGPAPVRPADRRSLGSDHVWPVDLSTGPRGAIVDRAGEPLALNQGGRRVYPNPELGHIVGFASRLYGTAGLEATFDAELSGAASQSPEAILRARLLGTQPEVAPADLRLSLASDLQAVAQAALGERAGAAVLLDTQTGAILAMASYPRFDPNQLTLPERASDEDVAKAQAAWQALVERPDSPLLNRAAQGRYPPGSVIKALTAAAALDSGLLADPAAQVSCPNTLQTEAGAPPVRNAVENLSRRTGDPSDLSRVFAFSCNTAFAQLGLGLGPERFADYAARFGLGLADAPRAADLQDIPADAGTIANDAAFLQRPVALADTAFGQGQALVTPLDMAQLAAAVANDGALLRPYLVEEIRAGERVLFQAEPERLREVMSPEAARELREVMRTSVEIGYAAPAALPGVSVGAKTGTAETPTGTPHSWFIALAPVEQPRFAVAVIVEYGGEGSRAALPVARQILAAALGVRP